MMNTEKNTILCDEFEKVARGSYASYLSPEETLKLYTEKMSSKANLTVSEIETYVKKRFNQADQMEEFSQSPIKLRF